MNKTTLALGLMLGLGLAVPAHALQCVPYARQISGLDLQGDAWRWWTAAQGVYDRGNHPQVGAVLVFKQTAHMRHGHVAVVRRVINKREIRIDHANWGTGLRTGRGGISLDAAVIDVSPHNDWSQVRVWHDASGTYGTRVNPSYGFIYSKDRPRQHRFEDAAHSAPPPATPHVIQAVTTMTLPATTSAMVTEPQRQSVTLTLPAARANAAQPSAAHLNAQVLAGLQSQGTAGQVVALVAPTTAMTKPVSAKPLTAKPVSTKPVPTKPVTRHGKHSEAAKKGGLVIKVSKTSTQPAKARTTAAK